MKKICVIGNGYVGQSMVKLFKDKHLVGIKEINDNYDGANQSDVAIVCVPTQMKKDGTCDTSIVEKVIKESDVPIYLIKSTIPPRTTQKLIYKYKNKRIVFSPEYIGEGNYQVPWWTGIPHPTESELHEFQIFGGEKKDTQFMVDLFSPIIGPYCKYIQTDATTAELVKYMENSYLATKVVFCHDFSKIVDSFGCDYREVRELFLLDKRCERGSTAIFDYDNLGYDGKCLPKDISAIYEEAKKNGYESKFLNQVMKTNKDLKND